MNMNGITQTKLDNLITYMNDNYIFIALLSELTNGIPYVFDQLRYPYYIMVCDKYGHTGILLNKEIKFNEIKYQYDNNNKNQIFISTIVI